MDKLCNILDKSCGGCCCIEIPEEGKKELTKKFRFRREVYIKNLAGKGNIQNYEKDIKKKEILLSIHTLKEILEKKCHYLGFLNDNETKVGCLAHPGMNDGKDLRDNGFYKSKKICQEFFCAAAETYNNLTSSQKKSFRTIISNLDWYNLSNQEKTYSTIIKFKESISK